MGLVNGLVRIFTDVLLEVFILNVLLGLEFLDFY